MTCNAPNCCVSCTSGNNCACCNNCISPNTCCTPYKCYKPCNCCTTNPYSSSNLFLAKGTPSKSSSSCCCNPCNFKCYKTPNCCSNTCNYKCDCPRKCCSYNYILPFCCNPYNNCFPCCQCNCNNLNPCCIPTYNIVISNNSCACCTRPRPPISPPIVDDEALRLSLFNQMMTTETIPCNSCNCCKTCNRNTCESQDSCNNCNPMCCCQQNDYLPCCCKPNKECITCSSCNPCHCCKLKIPCKPCHCYKPNPPCKPSLPCKPTQPCKPCCKPCHPSKPTPPCNSSSPCKPCPIKPSSSPCKPCCNSSCNQFSSYNSSNPYNDSFPFRYSNCGLSYTLNNTCSSMNCLDDYNNDCNVYSNSIPCPYTDSFIRSHSCSSCKPMNPNYNNYNSYYNSCQNFNNCPFINDNYSSYGKCNSTCNATCCTNCHPSSCYSKYCNDCSMSCCENCCQSKCCQNTSYTNCCENSPTTNCCENSPTTNCCKDTCSNTCINSFSTNCYDTCCNEPCVSKCMKDCYSECCNQCNIDEGIINICQNDYAFFLSKPYVLGLGLGYKIVNDQQTTEKCIKVYVENKVPSNALSSNRLIPPSYKGFKTDVVEVGSMLCFSNTDKIRPAKGGDNIGPAYYNLSGTLGCIVTDGQCFHILSCNHTLAGENALPLGSPIMQPSQKFNGDYYEDMIATLYKYEPLKFITSSHCPMNYVDCAIAKVMDSFSVSFLIDEIGLPSGINIPYLNEQVKKCGSITGLTTGIVDSIGATIIMEYDSCRRALFSNQIITNSMGTFGDSGSLLFNNNNEVLGLLCGGSNSITAFNPIDYVLNALNVGIIARR